MNRTQLHEFVVIPMLQRIPKGLSGIDAVMLIIAHESLRGEHLKQVGGPALGLIGMERPTYFSTWDNADSIWDNALICGIINRDEYDAKICPAPERLIGDLPFNVFMCRQRLFMKPGALPEDLKELSRYLKVHWNTIHGKAHDLSYFNDYDKWS